MLAVLAALLCGTIFGLGLIVSQMVNPAKVLNFLDIFGTWDPSLAFVMVTAIPVAAIGVALARRRAAPALVSEFDLPRRNELDARLIAGAALFGIGWGLGGFCPGPGLVAAGAGSPNALVFVAGMTIGMLIENAVARASARPRSHGDAGRRAT